MVTISNWPISIINYDYCCSENSIPRTSRGKTLHINIRYTCHNLLQFMSQEFLLDHKRNKNSFPRSLLVLRPHSIFKEFLPTAECFKQPQKHDTTLPLLSLKKLRLVLVFPLVKWKMAFHPCNYCMQDDAYYININLYKYKFCWYIFSSINRRAYFL